jgi:glucosamine--fructose-6-phosphate aminotransferase (isomerizing)
MCGIVGAVANQDILNVLVEGLKRLEYRGYDSSGIAVLNKQARFERVRKQGKIKDLEAALSVNPVAGNIGIAHTRWATHGKPSEYNAHPHICNNSVSIVHNGIIENFESLKEQQQKDKFRFTSDTDSELIAHQIFKYLDDSQSLLQAVQMALKDLEGAYALGVISTKFPDQLVVARSGSPLVIGVSENENFIASDVAALIEYTKNFIFLEEGDVAELTANSIKIFDESGAEVERDIHKSDLSGDAVERGIYRHYMLKEIFEQPISIANTLEGRISDNSVLEESFGPGAAKIFDQVKNIVIIACGTSYHAGLIAKYGFEALAGLSCSVEVASEYRYRDPVVIEGSLFITLSQSGETADTLAALRMAKRIGYLSTLSICNVPESSLVRESDLVLMTRAGPEIGVASTKAFTTQLAALLLLIVVVGRRHKLKGETEARIVEQLRGLPTAVSNALDLDEQIKDLAVNFGNKHNALFLGRGPHFPVALEGALKLKEISYIHAEGYPAGELKHGPLALVDAEMPIIAVAPNDRLLEKLKGNLQEVRARGGELYVFADTESGIETMEGMTVLDVAPVDNAIAPIVYSVPLQLLAYHVAVIKGTDVDQPRNLAKSVTVE